MTLEEASRRMDLLGHSFCGSPDSADSTISVIYRRHDGDYGLICPRRFFSRKTFFRPDGPGKRRHMKGR
jgi:hypothetical protein